MGSIGYTTIAGSSATRESTNAGFWDIVGEYTPAEDEVLDQGYLYADNVSGADVTIEIGCYRASDGVLMEKATLTVTNGTGPAWYSVTFGGTATLATGVAYRNALASPTSGAITVYRDVVSNAEGYDTGIDGSTGLTSPFTQDGTGNYRYSTYLTTTAATPALTIDNIDTDNDVFPGQSAVITGTGFGATQGTGGVTLGGVTQTVTSWSDTSITITVVQGGNSFGSGKILEVTADDATSGTLSTALSPISGNGFVNVSSPVTDDTSIFYLPASGTPATGDQVEYTDAANTTVNADGTFTQTTTSNFQARLWDATDGTWGDFVTVTVSEAGTVIIARRRPFNARTSISCRTRIGL